MSEEITVDVDPLSFGQKSENKHETNNHVQPTRGIRRIPKQPRKNGILNRQARMIIYNVNRFLKKEAEEGIKNVKQAQKRTAEATDTSVNIVRCIMKEGSSITKGSPDITEFKTIGKRSRAKLTDVSPYDQGIIKRCIHNFHITEKVLPSMIKLRLKLANDLKFQGSERSLRRIIARLGFRWKRTENNKKLLIEKSDIRFKRIEYLQKIRKYRQDGRCIIYTGETYIDSSFPITNSSNDPKCRKQVNKGQRIVVVHAGSEVGFVPNALLIFKTNTTNTRTGDIDNMSYENYKRWLRTQLIPNIPHNSVIVVDNATHHKKLYDPAPTTNSKITDMRNWLSQRRIYYAEDMLKPQLYNIIKSHKKQEKIYSIDKFLAESSHEVLRLPPHHPDLNPMEMAWTAVKWYVSKNTSWNADGVTELIKAKLCSLGPPEWNVISNKIKEIEEQYLRSDHVVDLLTEKFVVQVNDDDSGSDAESPSVSCNEASDDDEMIMPGSSHCNGDDFVKAFPFPLYP